MTASALLMAVILIVVTQKDCDVLVECNRWNRWSLAPAMLSGALSDSWLYIGPLRLLEVHLLHYC